MPSLRCHILMWLVFGVTVGILAGCTPSVAPLYHDYRIPPNEGSDDPAMRAKIERALQQANWSLAENAPPNAVETEPRTLRRWGLYRVTVYLEVAPIGDEYVRVFFHPYRKYVTGGRSKIPYLSKSLRRSLVPALNESFRTEGLKVADERLDDERRL